MTMWTFTRVLVFAVAVRLAGSQTCPVEETPTDLQGPFYIKGANNTRRLAPESILSNAARRIRISGTVYGDNCVPVKGALVEAWHAGPPDAKGNLYSVAGSELRYRGRIIAGSCGKYGFTTVYPTLYPSRPIRHIHFRISSGNKLLLVTQMYFKGAITAGFNPDTSQIVTLKKLGDGSRAGTFDIYVGVTGTGNAATCAALHRQRLLV